MQKDLKKTSKYLSLLLRHKPETIDLTLDDYGWAKVSELIEKSNGRLNKRNIQLAVEHNDKQRFAFSEDGQWIRANQGHSVKIDLGLEESIPPAILYHGTATRFLGSISAKGLISGNRNHVHLSRDIDTAIKVGVRHGSVCVLTVNAEKMSDDGLAFYVSKNGVWLTDHMPVRYIDFQDAAQAS